MNQIARQLGSQQQKKKSNKSNDSNVNPNHLINLVHIRLDLGIFRIS